MNYFSFDNQDEAILLTGSAAELRRLGEIDPSLPATFDTVDIMFAVVESAPVGTILGRVVLSETPNPEDVIALVTSPILPDGMAWEVDPDPTVGGAYPGALPGSVWRLVVTGALTPGNSGVLPGDADGAPRGIQIYVMERNEIDSLKHDFMSRGHSAGFTAHQISRGPSRGRCH